MNAMMCALHNVINRKDANGNFVLGPLPYTNDYLEPYIGERTVRYHYWNHLGAYIDQVNAIRMARPNDYCYQGTIEDLILKNKSNEGILYKNASQVYNHYLYFSQLNAKGTKSPMNKMLTLIEQQYGTWENLKAQLIDACMAVFGSGWVFLTIDYERKTLQIKPFVGTTTPTNEITLLAIDVWEHAYYLDYQNNRRRYLENFFEAIDWLVVERRLDL